MSDHILVRFRNDDSQWVYLRDMTKGESIEDFLVPLIQGKVIRWPTFELGCFADVEYLKIQDMQIRVSGSNPYFSRMAETQLEHAFFKDTKDVCFIALKNAYYIANGKKDQTDWSLCIL